MLDEKEGPEGGETIQKGMSCECAKPWNVGGMSGVGCLLKYKSSSVLEEALLAKVEE